MGYNSVVFICNDAIGAIEEDPRGWWEKAWDKLAMLTYKETKSFGHGHCGNGFEAVWNQHADLTGVIMVGRNSATVIGSSFGDHLTVENQDAVLKEILEKRGYRVTKRKVKA